MAIIIIFSHSLVRDTICLVSFFASSSASFLSSSSLCLSLSISSSSRLRTCSDLNNSRVESSAPHVYQVVAINAAVIG